MRLYGSDSFSFLFVFRRLILDCLLELLYTWRIFALCAEQGFMIHEQISIEENPFQEKI